jgi:hypothetical protein
VTEAGHRSVSVLRPDRAAKGRFVRRRVHFESTQDEYEGAACALPIRSWQEERPHGE